ncbi:MAG: hypothetical protein M1833_003815 [Piccolia ochrophora]|nr:MAG: hypothetical protein M1833_003815 [Piccolia ochrophora]
MPGMSDLVWLVARQTETYAAGGTEEEESIPTCGGEGASTEKLGLRISAIFVILVGSTFGAIFPIFANRHRNVGLPSWVFFATKYFGSGVIIATAFIHLLAPAHEALTDPCLTGPITEYTWVEGIVLMTVFVMFVVELMAMRYATFAGQSLPLKAQDKPPPGIEKGKTEQGEVRRASHVPGDDHLGHARAHTDFENYSAQLTAVFILEFGVIFHSIFIGLTLAVSGEEFTTLYIVLVFHQTFEGLGLGSRLAVTPWPAKRRWTPYIMGLAYGVTTPIAIAVGLGAKAIMDSRTALLVNGVFDSISAGILIYVGLVELMAHEFMFSESMRRASIKVVMAALGAMVMGAGVMAVLGKWA